MTPTATNGNHPLESLTAPPVPSAILERLQGLNDLDPEKGPSGRSRRAGTRLRWGFVAVGILAAAITVGGAWLSLGALDDPDKGLDFQKAERGKLVLSIVEKGELEAAKNSEVNCLVRSSGRGTSHASTIKWLIDDGTKVKKGDVLIRLDDSGLKEAFHNQEIVVAEKEALLTTAETDKEITEAKNDSDIRTAKNNVSLAEIDLEKFSEGDLQQKQKDVEGRITLSESDFVQWQDKVAWSNKMVKKGYLSTSQAQADEGKLRNAEISREKLREEKRVLNNYERRRTILDLENKLAQANQALFVAYRQAKAATAKAEAEYRSKFSILEKELQKLADLKEDIRNCTIVAPNDGMVVYYVPESSSRYSGSSSSSSSIVALGEPVREGQRLMRIPDLRHMQVKVKVHESLVPRLRGDVTQETNFGDYLAASLVTGMPGPQNIVTAMMIPQLREPLAELEEEIVEYGLPAKLRISSIEQPVDGHVTSVSAVASSTDWMSADVKVYPTLVTVDSTIEGLKPGMTAEVTILVDEIHDALRLPVHAVLTAGGKRFCYVKTEDGIEKRNLITGLNNAKFIEVKSGSELEEGELVVQNPRSLAEKLGHMHADVHEPTDGLRLKNGKSGRSRRTAAADKATEKPTLPEKPVLPAVPGAKPPEGPVQPAAAKGPGGDRQVSPEQRQQFMQQMMARFKSATPEERKAMIQQIPEARREQAKQFIKASGIEIPD